MSLGISLRCPCCHSEVFDRSPTYNLGPMWREAGAPLGDWEGKTGEEVAPLLRAAIERMKIDPDRFKALNPPNGWGSYEAMLQVLEEFLEAADRHSNFVVRLSP